MSQLESSQGRDGTTLSRDAGIRFSLRHFRISAWQAPLVILFGLLFFYLSMFLRYRPYEIDNPWFLSFSYDTCVENVGSDQFMNVRFPGGMDGTHLFGNLAAYLQCGLLAHAGWQQWPAVVLSSSFVVLALAFWWMQLRRLGYNTTFVSYFLLATGVSEPLLSAANKFRYEFLSFALISLGLLLIAYRRPFWGFLIAALAVEIEPMAVAGIIPLLVLALSIRKVDRKLFLHLAAGLAAAVAIYFSLHPNVLHARASFVGAPTVGTRFTAGFFGAYFLQRLRHLPELICFLAAAALYWHRRHSMSSHYLGISALALTVFSIAMPHGNSSYMVFAYPFLVAMALSAVQVERRPWLVVGYMLLFILPQQLYLIDLTRDQGYHSGDIAKVAQTIASAERQLQIPDGSLRIYGDYRLWFAHPHLYRAAALSTVEDIHNADLYLCFAQPPGPAILAPQAVLYCPQLNELLPLRLIDTISVRNDRLYVYARR